VARGKKKRVEREDTSAAGKKGEDKARGRVRPKSKATVFFPKRNHGASLARREVVIGGNLRTD